jgi:hypothetical protein
MAEVKRAFGWRPGLDDRRRDIPRFKLGVLPAIAKSVDLRFAMPDVWNQENKNSCVGHAVAGALSLQPEAVLSPLFAYDDGLRVQGTPGQDVGTSIRDALKGAAKWGICSYPLLPDDTWRWSKPGPKAVADANHHLVTKYLAVLNLGDAQAALSLMEVVIAGFTIYESFMSDKVASTGIIPAPKRNEAPVGGHAVAIVGYSLAKKRLLCRNSWGEEWGLGGYFWLPFSYWVYCGEAWTAQVTT